MTPDNGAEYIWGVGSLILVVSSLVARRLPIKDMAKMALAWIAIFAGLFAVFSFRPEIKIVWDRMKSDLGGTANQMASGKTMNIKRGDDGHFNVTVIVNGKSIPFTIDSGATYTSMSTAAADSAGIVYDHSSLPMVMETANGIAPAWRAQIARLQLGNIALEDHKITVSQNMSETSLLGMNFLDTLKSWKVTGDIMTLEPQ